MKYIIYEDEDGFLRRSLVKDNDDESDAPLGIPAGPPDVRMMDWRTFMRDLNNTLVQQGAFSWDDVQNSPAIPAALAMLKRHLHNLYREEIRGKKDIGA